MATKHNLFTKENFIPSDAIRSKTIEMEQNNPGLICAYNPGKFNNLATNDHSLPAGRQAFVAN